MKHTDEEIVEAITSELDTCLETTNAEIFNWADKIVEVDQKKSNNNN